MKRHTPVLIVVDDVTGPHMHIQTRCLECDVTISDRAIDASQIKEDRAGEFGTASGEVDADAWLAHVSEGKA